MAATMTRKLPMVRVSSTIVLYIGILDSGGTKSGVRSVLTSFTNFRMDASALSNKSLTPSFTSAAGTAAFMGTVAVSVVAVSVVAVVGVADVAVAGVAVGDVSCAGSGFITWANDLLRMSRVRGESDGSN